MVTVRIQSMLEYLYYLCIAPLEGLMRWLLEGGYSLTGSWGASLVLLSLAVNTLLLPLYHLAESWQEAERAKQAAMAAKLAEIKAVFKGRERYMLVRTLYRQHRYHPVMAVRTSFGFLIQVPFFFAAFHLLNDFAPLRGVSLWGIADLAAPDRLLHVGPYHFNVLPFVMTGANVLSAAVYTTRLTLREKRRLWLIAALFLALLYTSSAALLLYWTCNNIFSLFKNLVYARWVYRDAPGQAAAGAGLFHAAESVGSPGRFGRVEPAESSGQRDAAPRAGAAPAESTGKGYASKAALGIAPAPSAGRTALLLTLVSFLAGLAFFIYGDLLRKATSLAAYEPQAIYAFAALLFAAALFFSTRRPGRQSTFSLILPAVFLIGSMAMLLVWGLTPAKKVQTAAGWIYYRLMAVNTGLMTAVILSVSPFSSLLARLARKAALFMEPGTAFRLGVASLAAFCAVSLLYTPGVVFCSDPEFFYESAALIFARLTLISLALLAAGISLLRSATGEGKPLPAILLAWIGLLACLYTFLAPGDYGNMDEFTLLDTHLLESLWFLVPDILIPAGALLLLLLLLCKGYAAALTRTLAGVALVLTLLTAFRLGVIEQPPLPTRGEVSARLPDYNDALFGFSKTGSNILVIMLDMFSGGHVERMFAEDPDLLRRFRGFTWYPDTLAPGATTFLSLASLFGGEEYTPSAVNARRTASLAEEQNKAYALLPSILAARDFAVALAEIEGLQPDLFMKHFSSDRPVTLVGRSIRTAYAGYWRAKKGLPGREPDSLAPFLAAMGIFRASPWLLRRDMYNDGAWMNSIAYKNNRSEGPYALLDVLPDVAHAESPRSTFKFITSQISHYPWQLDGLTCLPADSHSSAREEDGIITRHYYAERCAMRSLGRFFDWMRERGIFNNTMIILVSDHDADDSPAIGPAFDGLRNGSVPWKPHALLMVKNPQAEGPWRANMQPMASSDLPALICNEFGPCPGLDGPDPLDLDPATRVRIHSSGLAVPARHKRDRFITRDYAVTGSMFEPENWRALPPEGKNQ